MTDSPLPGEVWMVDLDPTRGHEQAGTRPALVVSDDTFNHSPAGLVIVVPVISRDKQIRSHVRVEPNAASGRDALASVDGPIAATPIVSGEPRTKGTLTVTPQGDWVLHGAQDGPDARGRRFLPSVS